MAKGYNSAMKPEHWELLRAASRTFALSIERLPKTVGEPLGLAYLLLRVSDYLEDNEQMAPERKVALLQLWGAVLAGQAPAAHLVQALGDCAADPNPDALVALHAADLIATLQALPLTVQNHILLHVCNSTQGMARWVARGPVVSNEADMDDYMYEVAGRVGYLSTELFAWYSGFIRSRIDVLMPLARETGLALQTVNIIRGLRKDFERGWIFVPETFCGEAGLDSVQLFDPAHEQAALRVIGMLAAKARRHLDNGMAYIKLLPRWECSLRRFCIWPLLFAARTLAISVNNPAVLRAEAKITRPEVKRIVAISGLLYWSNALLAAYYKTLLKS